MRGVADAVAAAGSMQGERFETCLEMSEHDEVVGCFEVHV